MAAIAADDPQDRPFRAMTRIAAKAQRAMPAARIYLAYHPFPNQFRRIRSLFDHPDKFMPDRTRKPCVTAHDLEVGIANAGHR